MQVLKSHLKSVFLVAPLAFGLVPMTTSAASAGGSCVAMVQRGNNLWLVRADGTPIDRITNDTQPRYAAALNPLGAIAAFAGKTSPDDVTLIDLSGRTIANVSLNSQDAISGLTWLNATTLRAEEHNSPTASTYHFIDISGGATSPVALPSVASGAQCAPSPDGKNVACIIGGAEVDLNDRAIYHVPDQFTGSALLQTLNMASNTNVVTNTSPSFQVSFQGVSAKGKMNLRVTTPDGLWSEQSIAPGGKLVVRFQDAVNGAADYAFQPALTSPGVIRLEVRKATTGSPVIEGDLAWDPRGKRIAFVTAAESGNRKLIILNKEAGQAANSGRGAIDLEEALPIDGPVRSLAFVADTHIRVTGQTQQFDQDIPAQGKATNTKAFTITSALPGYLDVSFSTGMETTAVKGWSCK
jgi:hypothetical protein